MSFNFLGAFRAGSYKEFRRFVLNELRSVRPRIAAINTEIQRIGSCSISWKTDEADPNRMTERRIGFFVEVDTSLGKLLQAYVALGGNPFDISMFLNPRKGWTGEEKEALGIDEVLASFDLEGEEWSTSPITKVENQPSSGVAYPMTRDITEGMRGVDRGGEVSLGKNIRLRIGQGFNQDRASDISTLMKHARRWCNQEIRQKRNNLEWQILKLCDLKEQLVIERDDLIKQAVGNVLDGFSLLPNEGYALDLSVNEIFQTLDRIVFIENEEGWPDLETFNEVETEKGKFETIYADKDEEKWTAL